MKKTFFYALGMAAMLCGCGSDSVVVDGNLMTSTGFVGGLGNVTTTTSYYDFKEEDPQCTITGFSQIEDFGRWSSEDSCMVVFDKIVPNSELTAKLNVTMTCPSGEPVKYNVYANGAYICSGESFAGNIYVNIPAEKVGDNDNLTLSFKIKNPVRPIDINPKIYDSRLLGFAVADITLYGYSMDEVEDGEDED
ncbi:MAG: hypothetical protein KBT22_10030 [Bacteroidales bacterium]|nr:hypothetical protein [Candidatus Scybalocola fimicaballi]